MLVRAVNREYSVVCCSWECAVLHEVDRYVQLKESLTWTRTIAHALHIGQWIEALHVFESSKEKI